MNPDVQVKLGVYRHFAETGSRPSIEEVSRCVGLDRRGVVEAYSRLRAQRLLVLEDDGSP